MRIIPTRVGKSEKAFENALQKRIIPTRVGKSLCLSPFRAFPWDHPHACGEKRILICLTAKMRGSSPRVWGKVFLQIQATLTIGIIPTRVGKREGEWIWNTHEGDHPHACGEKGIGSAPYNLYVGSSPRVWGKAANPYGVYNIVRIIPTRVGKRLKKTVNFKAFYIPKSMFSFSFDRIPYSSKLSSSARCF